MTNKTYAIVVALGFLAATALTFISAKYAVLGYFIDWTLFVAVLARVSNQALLWQESWKYPMEKGCNCN